MSIIRTKFSSAMKLISHSLDILINNCGSWGSGNPQVNEERALHSEKVAVWCVLRFKGVIGPYFFENDNGTTGTINSVI